MLINKQFLIIFLCAAMIIDGNSMDKEGTQQQSFDDILGYTKSLHELLNFFETDSIVIERGKTILTNQDYNNNPTLLAAYGCLISELTSYKVGEKKHYAMFVERQALNISESIECVEESLLDQYDNVWKKEQEYIVGYHDVRSAKKKFNADLKSCLNLSDKAGIALLKKWMHARDFVSTKFLIEMICELIGESNLIEQEQTKILELLKKYDNQ